MPPKFDPSEVKFRTIFYSPHPPSSRRPIIVVTFSPFQLTRAPQSASRFSEVSQVQLLH